MKLTEKDRDFLNKLKRLMDLKDLRVELQQDRPSYMVLRGTYGDKIFKSFRMTRQGVRWRFHRVFNDAYVAAFGCILMIETTFGTHLREHAIRISKERQDLRQELGRLGFESADALRRRDEDERRASGGRE